MTTEYAVRFLSGKALAAGEEPFFLACGIYRPHLPWYVPKEFFDRYSLEDIVLPNAPEDDLDDLPAEGLAFAAARRKDFTTIKKADHHRQAIRAYLASITYADSKLGQVLDALDKSPHSKDTVVVLWSDHGWHLGEKQHWHKTTLWEEATRVPLIVSTPRLEPGVCNRPVSLLDLYPTLNELCGLTANQELDGVSLVPLLKNPKSEWHRPAVIEFKRGNAAVRSERYRYIRYHDGGEELYDHQTDPLEHKNLASMKRFEPIKKELAAWIAKDWAKSAPKKSAFTFDPQRFTWTEKKTGKVTHGKTR